MSDKSACSCHPEKPPVPSVLTPAEKAALALMGTMEGCQAKYGLEYSGETEAGIVLARLVRRLLAERERAEKAVALMKAEAYGAKDWAVIVDLSSRAFPERQ